MLAGFDFQTEAGSDFIFYKYTLNFPKLFLIKNVEKKGKAIRASFSIAYPHCVNIWRFEMTTDKNTFVITSRSERLRPKTQLNSF
jgi:hypothetical protein